MTKSKKHLVISLVVLVLTMALAAGSTYAWFTTNQRVAVDEMDMSVTTGTQGLYVSVHPDKAFKTSLSLADLKLAGFEGNKTILNNVTSTDGINMLDMGGATVSPGDPNKGDNTSYVNFKVYFRVTGSTEEEGAPTVNLEQLSLTSAKGPVKFYSSHPFDSVSTTYGKTGLTDNKIVIGDEIVSDAKDAMRMSFITQPFVKDPADNTEAGYYKGTDTARVWDPMAGESTTFCGLPNPDNDNKYDNKVGNFGIDYYNHSSDVDISFPAAGIAPTVNEASFTANALQFAWNPVSAAWEGRLIVRIWIEGFDGDCTNAILGNSVKSTMNFVIPQP